MRRTVLLTLPALLTLAAPAGAAFVSRQAEIRAPSRSPVTIPGARPMVRAGDRLSPPDVLRSRRLAMRTGERTTLILSCPRGLALDGLAPSGSAIGFRVLSPRRYPGRRAVRIEAFAMADLEVGEVARGSIYALCR